MNPAHFNKANDIIGPLSGALPDLAQVASSVALLTDKVGYVRENKNQCLYLLKRATLLSQTLVSEERDRRDSAKTLPVARRMDALLQMVNRLEDIFKQLSNTKKLRCFMQRQDVASRIQAAHKEVDYCIKVFSVENHKGLAFSGTVRDEAEDQDMMALLSALNQVPQSGEGILTVLEVRNEQKFSTILGLKNTLKDKSLGRLQREFATRSFDLLTKNWAADGTVYEWEISEMEVNINGAVIGAGGFAQVLLGTWKGTKVAVKLLKKQIMPQKLLEEIEIWQQHQHPHIAAFYKACIDPQCMFLISDFYEFGNVSNYLKSYPGADRLRLCRQIALGMNYLHSKQVIHADLKPENVLIDDGHRARIGDFGLSNIKTTQSAPTVPGSTGPAKGVSGTLAFMAPERLRRGSMTKATDVYAFGMTVYQIYAEESPFPYLPPELLYTAVVKECERPERPDGPEVVDRGLTNDIWEIIGQAWVQDPKQRPTFENIINSLEILERYTSVVIQHPPRFSPRPGTAARQIIPLPSGTSVLDFDTKMASRGLNALKRPAEDAPRLAAKQTTSRSQ